MYLILFLAAINLVASIYEAALPAMLLSREGGSIKALGTVNFFVGVASIAGSFWPNSSYLVLGSSSWMAYDSSYECKYGCYFSH